MSMKVGNECGIISSEISMMQFLSYLRIISLGASVKIL